MYNIKKPSEDLKLHLKNCIDRCRNKKELLDFMPKIIGQAIDYDNKAENGQLFNLQPLDLPFKGKRLTNLYETHMVDKDYNGRAMYDKLKSLAKEGRCPFCSQGIVHTLDHYLPKKVNGGFPELSAVPINLIPCCRDCNSKKSEEIPETANEQLIHPYYDEIDQERWLWASLTYEVDNKPTIKFYVNCPENWDETLKTRMNHHFEILDLASLYSVEAGTELSGNMDAIKKSFMSGGKNAVKVDLLERASSWEKYNKNSWRTAMYYALAEDERFYECQE